MYEFKINTGNNGEVDIATDYYSAGEEIDFKVIPDNGYELNNINVTKGELRENSKNNYSYVMPDEKAVLAVSFKKSNNINDYKKDTDGDGLSDYFEINQFNTDPKSDDTDGDTLTDSQEIFLTFTNPLIKDTDNNGIEDSDEDSDGDRLIDSEEIYYEKSVSTSDTDFDGLSDYEEVYIYKTNPLEEDSDKDGLIDSKDIELGFDPNDSDTDNDGILDKDETFEVEKDYEEEFQGADVIPSLDIELSANQIDTLEVYQSSDEDIFTSKEIPGFMGNAYEFKLEDDIAQGTITFKYDQKLRSNEEQQLAIYEIDKANQQMILLPNQLVDTENCTVSAPINSLSQKTYILLDKKKYDEAFMLELSTEQIGNDLDIVFAIDSSGSMTTNDRYGIRKDVTKDFIDILGEEDRVGIVDFDSYASILSYLTTDKESAKLKVDKIDSSGGTNISNAMSKSISVFNNTNTYASTFESEVEQTIKDGLEEGENGLDINNEKLTSSSAISTMLTEVNEGDKSKYIILLTDGDGTYNTSYTKLAKDNDIKVYTVGLGSGVNISVLEGIASGTGGKYFHANNADSLINEFEAMQEEIIDLVTDTDNDGLSDYHEKYLRLFNGIYLNTDPNNPDTDGDGILDGDEIEFIYDEDSILYFTILSDPTKKDTDKDLIPDNDDTRALIYNPNDVLIENIKVLESALKSYDNNIYNSKNFINRDKLLIANFIRSFNSSYTGFQWDIVGGEIDYDFNNYIESNYPDTYKYFENYQKYYGFKDSNSLDNIDLYHFAATYSGYLYETSAEDTQNIDTNFVSNELYDAIIDLIAQNSGRMFEFHINNLSGWAGDFQTLVVDCINDKDISDDMYEMVFEGIGATSGMFTREDELADADAYNINKIGGRYISEAMYKYYDLNGKYNKRYTMFTNNMSRKRIENLTHTYSKKYFVKIPLNIPWPIYGEIEISNSDADASSEAITDFYINKREQE